MVEAVVAAEPAPLPLPLPCLEVVAVAAEPVAPPYPPGMWRQWWRRWGGALIGRRRRRLSHGGSLVLAQHCNTVRQPCPHPRQLWKPCRRHCRLAGGGEREKKGGGGVGE